MNLVKFALVCHNELDPQLAQGVLEEYGGEVAAGIDFQVSNGRNSHVILTHESEDYSILFYAGNREFAKLNGFPIAEDDEYFAMSMSSDCEYAVEIKKKLFNEREVIWL